MFLGSTAWPARKADNFTAIFEPPSRPYVPKAVYMDPQGSTPTCKGSMSTKEKIGGA
jgi:hypothetical protein